MDQDINANIKKITMFISGLFPSNTAARCIYSSSLLALPAYRLDSVF